MGKLILLLSLFVGIILVVIQIVIMYHTCPPSTIEYRYIPRTFEEEQNEPVFPSDIFIKMFKNPSPWISGANEVDSRMNESLNKYFISQM